MDKNALEYIKQQSEQFSLEDFYLNNDTIIRKDGLIIMNADGVDGAMIVITPFQTISSSTRRTWRSRKKNLSCFI